jgi:hypothetical protein
LTTCFTPPRDTPHRVGCIMNNENDVQWKELCRQASVEKDPERLNQLAREINRLLEAKQNTNGNKTHQMDDLKKP